MTLYTLFYNKKSIFQKDLGLHKNSNTFRWNIVIHGAIGGFSRLPVFIKASDNNRSETVLEAFLQACGEYGIPERVRSDKGGENIKVAEYMLSIKGPDSKCFITGRSVHNQR